MNDDHSHDRPHAGMRFCIRWWYSSGRSFVKSPSKNLEKFFDRLRHYNLKLNPEKSCFFKKEVTYLGHKITDKGILPDDSKYDRIKNYPIPQYADDVRRYVAFCNCYRKFIPNFALKAKPLKTLLKKNTKFEWTQECQEAF